MVHEERQVFRPWRRNLVVIGTWLLLAVFASAEWSDDGGWPDGSWRLVYVAMVGAVLVARSLRRGMVVSTSGLEGRGVFATWRVPWSLVESVHTDAPGPSSACTVVLVDGSWRHGRFGPPRRGRLPFVHAVTVMSHRYRYRPGALLAPNVALIVALAVGIGVVTAATVADTGRLNRRLHEAGVAEYTADERRTLDIQILVASVTTIVLIVAAVLTTIAAFVWWRRARLAAARSRPDEPSAELAPFVVAPSAVFDAGGNPRATVSRHVPRAGVETHEFDDAVDGGFSVHAERRRGVWRVTSWTRPLHLVVVASPSHPSAVVVGADPAVWAIEPRGGSSPPVVYDVKENAGQPVASLARTPVGWRCQLLSTDTAVDRRLLCAAAVWAEDGHRLATPVEGDGTLPERTAT